MFAVVAPILGRTPLGSGVLVGPSSSVMGVRCVKLTNQELPPWFPQATEMWLAGYNQSQIARSVGIDHRRLSQWVKYLPPRDWASSSDLSEVVCSDTLREWCKKGHITQSPGRFYNRVELALEIERRLSRQCDWPECAAYVMSIRPDIRLCPTHVVRGRTYRYPIKSAEQKAKANAATQRWKEKNPEKSKAINKKALRRYRERRKAQP